MARRLLTKPSLFGGDRNGIQDLPREVFGGAPLKAGFSLEEDVVGKKAINPSRRLSY
jgi:hypothetical protein